MVSSTETVVLGWDRKWIQAKREIRKAGGVTLGDVMSEVEAAFGPDRRWAAAWCEMEMKHVIFLEEDEEVAGYIVREVSGK